MKTRKGNQRTYSPSGFSWNLWNQNKDEGCTNNEAGIYGIKTKMRVALITK